MFSIGEISRRTGIKVPTIRYYEEMGLIAPAGRTEGNQRRYDRDGLERLGFIRHARDLGFSIEAILALMELQDHPDRSCRQANQIASAQLADVRRRIAQLQALETELSRITDGCSGTGEAGDCYVLASLGDHQMCRTEH
ncbi:MerR family transcriptional regulator [Paracoccus sediminicola]|uniref:MerR family transcriptional regulator n=1 Tax=Paracoccus sediminicola TaxID=3017783 RepID=UPI0022EFDD2C|nr:helix-turn-helix domain-containing protein [Paracoccus sediminicola]WBU55462.1 helix-turn-helix domain-containing protein [Paracoccus sediminicola]